MAEDTVLPEWARLAPGEYDLGDCKLLFFTGDDRHGPGPFGLAANGVRLRVGADSGPSGWPDEIVISRFAGPSALVAAFYDRVDTVGGGGMLTLWPQGAGDNPPVRTVGAMVSTVGGGHGGYGSAVYDVVTLVARPLIAARGLVGTVRSFRCGPGRGPGSPPFARLRVDVGGGECRTIDAGDCGGSDAAALDFAVSTLTVLGVDEPGVLYGRWVCLLFPPPPVPGGPWPGVTGVAGFSGGTFSLDEWRARWTDRGWPTTDAATAFMKCFELGEWDGTTIGAARDCLGEM